MLNNPKTYLKGAVHNLVVRPLGEKMQQLVDQNQHLMSRVDRLVQQNEDLLGQFDPLLTRFRQLVEGKREMIDYIGKMFPFESFADLGGAWTEPEGGYTFYTLERYRIPKGFLVDGYVTPELLQEVARHPGLQFLQSDLSSPKVAEAIGQVDVIFLFDVLYLQANPGWEGVLEMYAPCTRCFLVSNVHFNNFDRPVRLFDLGKDEYFQCVPYTEEEEAVRGLFEKLDEIHPEFGCKYRDCHHFWQWGLTDDALIGKMKSLGFRMHYLKTMFKRDDIQQDAENRAFVFLREPIRIFPYR